MKKRRLILNREVSLKALIQQTRTGYRSHDSKEKTLGFHQQRLNTALFQKQSE